MSLFQTKKPKSAAKIMLPASERLTAETLNTLKHISQMVSQTLGPGGKQVLIERPEVGMKPIATKDGVTVFKHLGYESAIQQVILEAARDAAIRTANDAGDGTTTATILSYAIAELTAEVLKNNDKISPQSLIRAMQSLIPSITKFIESHRIDVNADNYEEVLRIVGTISANGDVDLANKILEAIDQIGEEGSLTIAEINMGGTSRYEVERLNGYTLEKGYEESCRNFATGFLNDKSGSKVVLEKPVFILYDGVINDISQVADGLIKLTEYMVQSNVPNKNAVIVAHGFSDSVVGDLHVNWNHPKAQLKIFPLLTPSDIIRNYGTHILYDLQAYVGVPVFNPIDRPFTDIDPKQLCDLNRATKFECERYKSLIYVNEDPDAIALRVEELKLQKEKPESEYELRSLELRIGKLTSGIARLNIYGPSAIETREKRDRAEDAWMAIKGTIKHGAVTGGGYILVRLAAFLQTQADKITDTTLKLAAIILGNAMLEPVKVLYKNYGYTDEQVNNIISELLRNDDQTFDLLKQKWVSKYELLDSVPALVEAIRNSISIASLLGTLGGIIAFPRDHIEDRKEADFVREFSHAIGERGSTNGTTSME